MDRTRLLAALDATWPPAEQRDDVPGWRLRRGANGGKRASAATPRGAGGDIAAAEAAMRAWGQTLLFRPDAPGDAVDLALESRGYAAIDPTIFCAGPVGALCALETPKGVRHGEGRARLALLDEIWEAGGIDAGRRAVMDRVAAPKAVIMARTDMAVAGVAFVAVDGDLAMIHAIEVRPEHRRQGGGRATLRGAAMFARDHGASTLALAVLEANDAARALYLRAGMTEHAGYRYRIAPQGD